jgi:outer membrane protein OmpA-like peptidoglycan-associated protein
LLRSQASHLGGILPAGLANSLGIGNIVPTATDAAKSAASSVQTASAGMADRVRVESAHAAGAVSSSRGVLRWAWIPALLILGGLLLFRQSRKDEPAMGGTADQTYSTTQTSQLNLTGLQSLSLTPGSIADRTAKAITTGQFAKPVELPNTDFDQAGELSEAGQKDLAEVATVIRVVPGINVTAAAYGKTAEEGEARANEIKSILVAKGAPAGRVTIKGMEGSGAAQLILSK